MSLVVDASYEPKLEASVHLLAEALHSVFLSQTRAGSHPLLWRREP
jgi:hypothetical protein